MAGAELFVLGALALLFVALLRRAPLEVLAVTGLVGLAVNSGASLPRVPGAARLADAKAQVSALTDDQARRAACNASALRSLAAPEDVAAETVKSACS